MKDFEAVLEKRIKEFVGELQALVRHAALAAVQDALGGAKAEATKAAPRAKPKKRPVAAPVAKKEPAALGARRSPDQLNKTVAKLRSQIREKPGQSIEQIATTLGTPTKDLALPVKKLIARGEVRKEGIKRNTKYFPASGDAQSAPEPRVAKRRSTKK